METIDINEVFAQANVVENLKNFAGIDAQNALGMMTPERLAAVVGGKLGFKHILVKLQSGETYTLDSNAASSVNISSGGKVFTGSAEICCGYGGYYNLAADSTGGAVGLDGTVIKVSKNGFDSITLTNVSESMVGFNLFYYVSDRVG